VKIAIANSHNVHITEIHVFKLIVAYVSSVKIKLTNHNKFFSQIWAQQEYYVTRPNV